MQKGLKMATAYWPDIEVAFTKNWPIIIPLGASCKEHGYHLPMNTDFILAEYLADWVCDNYEVLVAPTIQDNYFPAFVEYPGSSTLSINLSRDYLVEKCLAWYQQMVICNPQTIKKFYVLNTGISTNNPLAEAREILQKQNIIFEYLNLLLLDNDPDVQKIIQQKVGSHADEVETSMMLYIKSGVVKMNKAIPEENPDKPGPLTRDVNSIDKTISISGAWGNPTLATSEKGEFIINVLKRMLHKQLLHLHANPN